MAEVKTIFIVDDDNMQAMMLQDYLSKYTTFTTHLFSSGEECLKNLSLNPQIVFLDYNFDKIGKDAMNGTEILKEIKAQKPETEVIMFSGQDKIEVAVSCMHHNAFDYVVKSETAFARLQKIIAYIFQYQKMKRELSWYMERN